MLHEEIATLHGAQSPTAMKGPIGDVPGPNTI